MKVLSFNLARTEFQKPEGIDFYIGFFEWGWGNGYIALPPNHPFYEYHYDIIPEEFEAPGGFTYSTMASENNYKPDNIPDDYWLIGYDTAHAYNNPRDHDEVFVVLQTERLRQQFQEVLDNAE